MTYRSPLCENSWNGTERVRAAGSTRSGADGPLPHSSTLSPLTSVTETGWPWPAVAPGAATAPDPTLAATLAASAAASATNAPLRRILRRPTISPHGWEIPPAPRTRQACTPFTSRAELRRPAQQQPESLLVDGSASDRQAVRLRREGHLRDMSTRPGTSRGAPPGRPASRGAPSRHPHQAEHVARGTFRTCARPSST